ncbi:MAG: hypothetical protein DMF54_15025 [Acidobacteria bacterium]|nr:MAG: hypothetical protein DMF54_15025 [Acidobacteriota bacterium]
MNEGRDRDRAWAILFARGVLGLIFFMAGVWKVFELTPAGHAHKYFVDPYADTFLPTWSLWAVGVAVPIVELVAGALVILGLRVRTALIALGLVLLVVTFGHLLKEPLYEFHTHVIPRLALLLFVLVLPREEDRFSLDALLERRRKSSIHRPPEGSVP